MLVQGAGLTTGGLRNTAMETALDQFSAMVGERARTHQGKLSQGTGLQCWCGKGAAVQGAAGGGRVWLLVAQGGGGGGRLSNISLD